MKEENDMDAEQIEEGVVAEVACADEPSRGDLAVDESAPAQDAEGEEESSDADETDADDADADDADAEDEEEYEFVELELDEDDIESYLVDEDGNEIGFTMIDEEGNEIEYFYVEEEEAETSTDDDDDEFDLGITKEGVAQATDDVNAIYKDGIAVAAELKGAFDDIKSAFDFSSFKK